MYLVIISSKEHLQERMSKVAGSTGAQQMNPRHGEIPPSQGSEQEFDLMSQKVLKIWL